MGRIATLVFELDPVGTIRGMRTCIAILILSTAALAQSKPVAKRKPSSPCALANAVYAKERVSLSADTLAQALHLKHSITLRPDAYKEYSAEMLEALKRDAMVCVAVRGGDDVLSAAFVWADVADELELRRQAEGDQSKEAVFKELLDRHNALVRDYNDLLDKANAIQADYERLRAFARGYIAADAATRMPPEPVFVIQQRKARNLRCVSTGTDTVYTRCREE